MITRALIGLGSNLGDRTSILDGAIASLRMTPGVFVHSVSSYEETAPVGGPHGQGPFLNAAAILHTTLEADALLERLRAIETGFGRVRLERWGERTLDLDLLLYGGQIQRSPGLLVPHPRMAVRRFVIGPACEIAPDEIEPITGRSIRDLLENLDRRPSHVCVLAESEPLREDVLARLARALGPLSSPASEPSEGWILSHIDKESLTHRWTEPGTPPRTVTALLTPLPPPTFVAALSLKERLEASVPGSVPVLWIEAKEAADIAAEILAGCAASRSGRHAKPCRVSESPL